MPLHLTLRWFKNTLKIKLPKNKWRSFAVNFHFMWLFIFVAQKSLSRWDKFFTPAVNLFKTFLLLSLLRPFLFSADSCLGIKTCRDLINFWTKQIFFLMFPNLFQIDLKIRILSVLSNFWPCSFFKVSSFVFFWSFH